jgi:hypothetical protein
MPACASPSGCAQKRNTTPTHRERVSQPPDFTAAAAESFADHVADSGVPMIFTPAMLRGDLLPCQPPEQKHTEHDEKNIWEPDKQFRMRMRISTQRIANDNKEKIGGRYDQTHGEPD